SPHLVEFRAPTHPHRHAAPAPPTTRAVDDEGGWLERVGGRAGPNEPASPPPAPSVVHLLGQVVLPPELLDQAELRLEPVDRLLLLAEDVLQERPRAVVVERGSQGDAAVEPRDGVDLEGQVDLVLFHRVLPDPPRVSSVERRVGKVIWYGG